MSEATIHPHGRPHKRDKYSRDLVKGFGEDNPRYTPAEIKRNRKLFGAAVLAGGLIVGGLVMRIDSLRNQMKIEKLEIPAPEDAISYVAKPGDGSYKEIAGHFTSNDGKKRLGALTELLMAEDARRSTGEISVQVGEEFLIPNEIFHETPPSKDN